MVNQVHRSSQLLETPGPHGGILNKRPRRLFKVGIMQQILIDYSFQKGDRSQPLYFSALVKKAKTRRKPPPCA